MAEDESEQKYTPSKRSKKQEDDNSALDSTSATASSATEDDADTADSSVDDGLPHPRVSRQGQQETLGRWSDANNMCSRLNRDATFSYERRTSGRKYSSIASDGKTSNQRAIQSKRSRQRRSSSRRRSGGTAGKRSRRWRRSKRLLVLVRWSRSQNGETLRQEEPDEDNPPVG